MDIKQIKSFVCLYDELNFGRAARRLNIVQPALSVQIRRLESELGVSLFQRTGRGVIRTNDGTLFHQLCVPILRDFEKLRRRMQDLSGETAGEIAVGLIPSITNSLLAEVLSEFTKRFPNVTVRAAEAYSAMLADRVIAGKLDFAVINNLGNMGGLIVQRLVTEDLVLVTERRKGGKVVPVEPLTLVKMNLVLPTRENGLRAVIEQYFSAKGLKIKPSLELDSLVPALRLVETSGWATILPLSAVRRAASAGRVSITPFIGRPLARELVLIYRARDPLTRAAERFVQLLSGHLRLASMPTPPQARASRVSRKMIVQS